MQRNSRVTILAACRYLILPLARLLLRYGVGYREFSDVCKSAFVEVASGEYGLRGRPANLSRVAILTGLSRKEVKKLRDQARPALDSAGMHGLNPGSTVLRGWFSDPEFLSETGAPAPMSVDGRDPSITSLVKRYAGDLPVRAVINEMMRMGVVEEMPSGRFKPIGRLFFPPNVDGQLFAAGATSIHNLISTIAHNVEPKNKSGRLFERYAWSNYLPASASDKFHALVSEKGSEVLEYLDSWLRKHEKGKKAEGGSRKNEVGVGVYFFNVSKPDDPEE